MFSLFCLVASIVILYCVIKFRVHVYVHVECSPSSSRGSRRVRVKAGNPQSSVPPASLSGRRAEAPDRIPLPVEPTATTRPVQSQETTPIQDLQSALVNLGAKPHRAKAAAEHVCRNLPQAPFDTLLRVAIQEVQAA
jgi:hypothetical protein